MSACCVAGDARASYDLVIFDFYDTIVQLEGYAGPATACLVLSLLGFYYSYTE